MNELVQALALADEDFFIGLSNKGVYKRAMKDIEGVSFQMPSIEDNQINVPIAEDRVTLMLPLSESKCSCVSRTICRHIISAMLLVKNNLPEEVIEINEKRAEIEDKVNVQEIKEETKPELSEKQIIQINSTSGDALSVLAEILISGMVRLPDRIEEKIEIMAVQCHALKMADAERILRDIGNRLNECVSRKSSFNKKVFLRNYCEGIKVLTMLSKPDITANNLGVFRRTYEEHDDNLSLLPIGNRQVFGNDYEGDIYYFLDTNENVARRFYSLSDIRPTFYFNQGKRKTTQPSEVRPWGLNVPLKKMMHTKMTLKHAKTNGMKLSSSKETEVICQEPANLDCDEVRSMLHHHFASIAIELHENASNDEGENLFFFHPKRCISSMFDRYSQDYYMILEDYSSKRVSLRVHYKSQYSELINILEEVGKNMIDNPQNDYVLLVSAYLDGGKLILFPIEIYDFIRPGEVEEFCLPDSYCYSDNEAEYAFALLKELDSVQDRIELYLQCGLVSGNSNTEDGLAERLRAFGLKGLAQKIETLTTSFGAYRHGSITPVNQILSQISEVITYVNMARKRLEIIIALMMDNSDK